MINIIISDNDFLLRRSMKLDFSDWSMPIDSIYIVKNYESLDSSVSANFKNKLLYMIFLIEKGIFKIIKSPIFYADKKSQNLNKKITDKTTFIEQSELKKLLKNDKIFLIYGSLDFIKNQSNYLHNKCYLLSFSQNKYMGMEGALLAVLDKNNKTYFSLSKFSASKQSFKLLREFSFRSKLLFFPNLMSLELRLRHYIYLLISDDLKPIVSSNLYKKNRTQKNKLNFIRVLIYPFTHYIYFFYYFLIKSIFLKRNNWTIAFGSFNGLKNLQIERANIIPSRKNQFLADPFIYKYKNVDYIFLEAFHKNNKKGNIEVHRINGTSLNYIGNVLNENFHLSFPFIFNHEDGIYMIPETSEINEIRIYKCTNFPLDWKHISTPIKNISAADSVIFKKNEYWHILTNIDTFNTGDHCSELYAFSSQDLFSSNWIPNKLNPIITNSDLARNGGLFFYNEEIYRVSQIHSFLEYGVGRSISKVNMISESKYSEDLVSRYFAEEDGYTGSHHLCVNKDYFVTDLKK